MKFSSLKLGHPWDLFLGMPEIHTALAPPGSILPLLDLRPGAEETVGYSKSEPRDCVRIKGRPAPKLPLHYLQRAQR
jgi:hypothetical protein